MKYYNDKNFCRLVNEKMGRDPRARMAATRYIAQVPRGAAYARPYFVLEGMLLARMVPFEIIDIIFDWNAHCPGQAYDLDCLGSASCRWCGVDTACWGPWWWNTHNTYNGPNPGKPGHFYTAVTCSSSCCWHHSNSMSEFKKECACACDCECDCAYTSTILLMLMQ